MDEFSRINRWNTQRQTNELRELLGVKVGIGDDAAVVSVTKASEHEQPMELLYTVDTMVEGVHFISETMSLEQIGYKALATNLSDIAAMGGIPLHALISISMPNAYDPEQINEIYNGIYACANRYQVAIVGGDTTSSPHTLVISITVIGQVKSGKAILRSGAKQGDIVFLTGVAGQSAAGLHALQHMDAIEARQMYGPIIIAHQKPEPHLMAGKLLLECGGCHSLNDVSDGLASELSEIAKSSKLDIVIQEQLLPISNSLSQYALYSKQSMLDWILYGGEDYILVGTVHVDKVFELESLFANNNLPFYQIGFTQEGNGQLWLESWDEQFRKLERKKIINRGYNHFI